ncbi:MAG: tetratricopeptide repeat protein [Neisseriaceae bacterium]
MRNLLIILVSACLFSCATDKIYDNNEFTTDNYQKNIESLALNIDGFKNLNKDNKSSRINTSDIGTLIQADLYFSQENYINALPFYEKLAYQYKIPNLIYKAIICYERSGLAKLKTVQLNSLITLLIQAAPNTSITKILQIRQALYRGDIKLAENALNDLIKSNPDNARNYLLFLSSMVGSNNIKTVNKKYLDSFADYVLDKYRKYPESFLLASTLYATTNSEDKLIQTLAMVNNNFKGWQIPLFWSVGILSANENYGTIINIVNPYIVNNPNPNLNIQNIYIGALINGNQKDKAFNYLNNQAKVNDSPNVELNFGILFAINKDYTNAISHFTKAKMDNQVFNNVINLLVGLMYDTQRNYQYAIKHYELISNNEYIENIANVMLVNDYSKLHNNAKIDGLLTKIINDKKLTGIDAILFKASSYMNIGDYRRAYYILNRNYNEYKTSKEYVYLFASILALQHKTIKAINLYKYYIKLDPKLYYGYNDLAYIYAEQTKDYKSALKFAKQAAKINISDYNVLDTLGWVYYKMGDYATAYPLINSSYQAYKTEDSAKHLKAVLIALNKPELANKVIIVNKEDTNMQLTKMLADKVLGILMLIQYGLIHKSIN